MTTNTINHLEREELGPYEGSELERFGIDHSSGISGSLCRVRFQKVLMTRTKYGGIQLLFQISEPGHPLAGQPVICFCNTPPGSHKRAGEIIWPPGSKYAKAWILSNGGMFPKRWDRLTPKVFKGKVFEAELVTSGTNRQLHLLGDANRSDYGDYKIHRLIRLIPDEGTAEDHLVHDKETTESHQKSAQKWAEGVPDPASNQGKEGVQTRKRDIYSQQINKGTGVIITPALAIRASPIGSPAEEGTARMDRFGVYGIIIDPKDPHQTEQMYVVCPQSSVHRKKATGRCLSVNPVYGTWKCFHCCWAGNVSVGVTQPSIIEPQARDEATEEVLKPGLPVLARGNERQALLAFMAQRGISEQVVDHNGVELKIDRQGRGWINFPYRRNGEYVYTKSRRYDCKEFRHYVEGAYAERPKIQRILYNEDALRRKADWIVIVEGELDALAVQTAGIEQVVSVPTGAGEKHCDWLAGVITEFQGLQCVVLAVDRDDPGRQLAEKLKQVLEQKIRPDLCQEVNWDDECECSEEPRCKDANDMLLKHGRDRLVRTITEAAMKNTGVLV